MVKGDPNQDYYADLELQPGADTADVKRAFRRLGRLAK
jgi:curved DNA-binding protein CbpA